MNEKIRFLLIYHVSHFLLETLIMFMHVKINKDFIGFPN